MLLDVIREIIKLMVLEKIHLKNKFNNNLKSKNFKLN